MALLHALSEFMEGGEVSQGDRADYHYLGTCPRTGQHHTLPRTALTKAIAQGLMAQLPPADITEGKMYGVLLGQDTAGQLWVLKAFSGLWRGQRQRPGWVPPIPGREQVALQEAQTLHQLSQIKDRLLTLQHLPERATYALQAAEFTRQRQGLNAQHRQNRQRRAQQRQQWQQQLSGAPLTRALADLDQQSRRDKAELRAFKHNQRQTLEPLAIVVQRADQDIIALKRRRKGLSQQLQAQMHRVYTLTNFAGESLAIQDLAAQGNLPTGTGDCCAPKLLHWAAQQGLKPLAMAEFWWGQPQGDKQPGQFYGACTERCQPIMGFLLGGLAAQLPGSAIPYSLELPVLYADEGLLVVNKPPGLLSVPGRSSDRADSVLARLQLTQPEGAFLKPVHRLDQDTSGILLLARTAASHRHLCQQFQQRQVTKVYDALLDGVPPRPAGVVDLPLWGDPTCRPRQSVDWQQGKPSITRYQVVDQETVAQGTTTRVTLYPLTGRTHQLRVHAAHPLGLNAPIQGDRLYGVYSPGQRLCLHASYLRVKHPHTNAWIEWMADAPF
ncbi:RluA family pseudouridine synthase [Nodosilinea sp. P-1105]|uniref:RluA family pseudouridine synthase n=1 Tax=Nodosilinea sp. P-1105 TaxID=2546229 RepID=UPI00146BD9C2|nr:RluA family pseudouridine synthase [Nodosilinea sp. P-1105]NMF85512.1 RluA family pseudouridine synthase [Nodosilinea sp. P-1105]